MINGFNASLPKWCHRCTATFRTLRAVLAHINEAHGERPRCPTCKRPMPGEGRDGECLHGMAPAPEPFTGGLDLSPQEVSEIYEISLAEAREILGIAEDGE